MTEHENAARDAAKAALDALIKRGYDPMRSAAGLEPGMRIRHAGHQWPEAIRSGTGRIHGLAKRGLNDIELVAVWDKPCFGSTVSTLADYHVRTIATETAESERTI